MARRRVTRRICNPIPPPPPVEEDSHVNPAAQENLNTAPPVASGQANPTNLPAPPTDLATAIMNLAQQLQQIQQVQVNMQAAIGMAFPAAHTTPMLAVQASTVPGGSNTLDHSRLIEHFLKMKPKEFNGKPADPLWPAHWIDEMERNFMMMIVNEEEKGSIREHVLGLEKKVYNEAVQIARVIESSQKESYFAQNRGIKRPNGNSYNGGNTRTFKPFHTQGFNAAAKTTPAA
ncbi:hypothetical protein NE237_000904 [Protea cynaroides]|uniref:Uncharacterized protein n=1 Tax=Protea cynaroides TaxID=273540 RepID=A0A9Q0KS07_9MAGN|nr:hypothetical protein NE237_000904 [Protea cynaroides]